MARNKNVRPFWGHKEREIWEKAGVSRSSIQRYKRGTKLSPKIMQKIENAIPEVKLQRLAEKLSEKQRNLDKYFKEEGLGENQWHRETARMLGKGFFDPTGQSIAEIERHIALAEKMLDAKTSTPKGDAEWRANTRAAALKTFNREVIGYEEVEDVNGNIITVPILGDKIIGVSNRQLDDALDAFNKMMDDNEIKTYIEANYGDGPGKALSSWQKVEVIQKLFKSTRSAEFGKMEDRLANFERKAREWYKRYKDTGEM